MKPFEIIENGNETHFDPVGGSNLDETTAEVVAYKQRYPRKNVSIAMSGKRFQVMMEDTPASLKERYFREDRLVADAFAKTPEGIAAAEAEAARQAIHKANFAEGEALIARSKFRFKDTMTPIFRNSGEFGEDAKKYITAYLELGNQHPEWPSERLDAESRRLTAGGFKDAYQHAEMIRFMGWDEYVKASEAAALTENPSERLFAHFAGIEREMADKLSALSASSSNTATEGFLHTVEGDFRYGKAGALALAGAGAVAGGSYVLKHLHRDSKREIESGTGTPAR